VEEQMCLALQLWRTHSASTLNGGQLQETRWSWLLCVHHRVSSRFRLDRTEPKPPERKKCLQFITSLSRLIVVCSPLSTCFTFCIDLTEHSQRTETKDQQSLILHLQLKHPAERVKCLYHSEDWLLCVYRRVNGVFSSKHRMLDGATVVAQRWAATFNGCVSIATCLRIANRRL
jgi:hypothetical protein